MVAGYGAGGKGQAIVNMCGLDAAVLPYILDEIPEHIGKFVPGTGNRVIHPDDSDAATVGAVLVTAPTHIDAVSLKLADRVSAGLQVMATTPDFHYVTADLRGI